MEETNVINFQSLRENIGRFDLAKKTLLMPEMNRTTAHVLAGVFKGFGINAHVLETFKGLDLGKEYTSGKECYPCQITTGDILHFLMEEQERLGDRFNAENYVYFMPEAEGPCRFGMYNKYQRIVLDSFPEFKKVKISALTAIDGYSLDGIISKRQSRELRKVSFWGVIVADILDRLLWRIRPYERKPGSADAFIENAIQDMHQTFEALGPKKDYDAILNRLDEIVQQGRKLIDPSIPAKPLIGIVGEIYLRTHVHANQDLIRVLEQYGAEVVNASIGEWINYISYDRLREERISLRFSFKQKRWDAVKDHLKSAASYAVDLLYQQFRQKQIYRRIGRFIDIESDHSIGHLEDILKEKDMYSFDAGTEACLSIPGIIEYARQGFNGVVNVYPFTCMPSTTTSAIIKPVMDEMRVPYLDTPYDESFQPGRESALRTFMYQAYQHYKRNGRKRHH